MPSTLTLVTCSMFIHGEGGCVSELRFSHALKVSSLDIVQLSLRLLSLHSQALILGTRLVSSATLKSEDTAPWCHDNVQCWVEPRAVNHTDLHFRERQTFSGKTRLMVMIITEILSGVKFYKFGKKRVLFLVLTIIGYTIISHNKQIFTNQKFKKAH